MPLSSEMRDKYTEIIDTILAESDLNTISEKRIRKGLQEAVGYDLTPQKTEIKQLIMERFDRFAEQNGVGSPEETTTSNGQRDGDSTSAAVPSPPPSSSPVKRQASSDVTSEPASASPPAKKHKSDDVDADAMFAARLQAEENSRARPTRGGNSRRAAAPKKKTKKAKTSTRVRAEDDSDIGSGSETKEKKEVNRNTGFHKPLNLSEPSLRFWEKSHFRGRKPSKRSGSTFVRTSSKIPVTVAKFDAMMPCVLSSNRTESICLP
ncbi:hypothetical protein N7460_012479 [Penicillium canescens]|uniref:DEK-C domain-containing protein n=1 Tax=Penicillium canescens TaxID=5083 RepID=A0AAD6I2L6_PENCN|nr:hypothetical protein N7460_012479 [Penicillium canescens]